MKFCLTILLSFAALALAVAEEVPSPTSPVEIVVSVAEQKLAVMQDGVVVKKYMVSTSRYGIGDNYGSYRTPIGKLRVCEKMGDKLPQGAVFKKRVPTGEILPVNAPGRDPIVTRIMWLDGTEATNSRARERGIYIHGTPVERLIGRPVSFGCIRMRSCDVVDVYNMVPVGTAVTITMDKLPKPANKTWGNVIDLLVTDNSSGKKSGPKVVTR